MGGRGGAVDVPVARLKFSTPAVRPAARQALLAYWGPSDPY